ncbi:MAG: hypothetical protein AAF587_44360, partial [Bacteroidota bacterium]
TSGMKGNEIANLSKDEEDEFLYEVAWRRGVHPSSGMGNSRASSRIENSRAHGVERRTGELEHGLGIRTHK